MNVEVNVKDRVSRPVHEVFAAIVDPAKRGTTVEWVFADVGGRLDIGVQIAFAYMPRAQ